MTLDIRSGGRVVSSVGVVDDDSDVRGAYVEAVRDAQLAPVEYRERLPAPPRAAVDEFRAGCDAAICDNRLRVSGYASYDGTELVVECYKAEFPAVLCTSYETGADDFRPYLPWMPVRLTETELDPSSLRRGIEICLAELTSGRPPHREPWKTLIYVDRVEEHFCFVVVPAWDPHQKIRIPRTGPARAVTERLVSDMRCFGWVNLGAESLEELFIMHWELE